MSDPRLVARQNAAAARNAKAAKAEAGWRREWGTVTATHTAPTGAGAPWPSVTVTVRGASIPGVRYLAAYSPSVDDVVIVDVSPTGDPVVLGVLA